MVALFVVLLAHAADLYPDFAALARARREGVDYRVEQRLRDSATCVLAIHGGRIEEGSERLARAIAGTDFSLYVFEATLPRHNRDLHVTSTHFDDPRAIAVARSAARCLSIHGFKEDARDIVCVGGGNAKFRDFVAQRLRAAGSDFEVESPCARFGGATPANITNRAKHGGVQIELSTHLRERFKDQGILNLLARQLKSASLDFTETN